MEAAKDISGLIKALDHTAFDVYYDAGQALSRIGQPAVEPLITVMANHSASGESRRRAAQTLAEIGDPRVVDSLLALLQESGSLVWTAAEGLGKMGAASRDPGVRSRIAIALNAARARDEFTATYALRALIEMGVFGSPKVWDARRYEEESIAVGGEPHRLTLESAEADAIGVTLVYHWYDEIPHTEADRLDSRLRAYIACAIYDAADACHFPSGMGERWGRRPSWVFEGSPEPYSLQQAGFDTDQKVCQLRVGCIIRAMPTIDSDGCRPLVPEHADRPFRRMASTFSRSSESVDALLRNQWTACSGT